MASAVKLAEDLGFEAVAKINMDQVVVSEELTRGCNPQACRKYASCWTCPPGAGTFEERQAHFKGKSVLYDLLTSAHNCPARVVLNSPPELILLGANTWVGIAPGHHELPITIRNYLEQLNC